MPVADKNHDGFHSSLFFFFLELDTVDVDLELEKKAIAALNQCLQPATQ